jgi:hypothetical protein
LPARCARRSLVAGRGNDDGNHLADEADAILGQARPLQTGDRHARQAGQIGEICSGPHTEHARHRAGLAGVDRDDVGVRLRRAGKGSEHHPIEGEIVGVLAATGEQVGVLFANDY